MQFEAELGELVRPVRPASPEVLGWPTWAAELMGPSDPFEPRQPVNLEGMGLTDLSEASEHLGRGGVPVVGRRTEPKWMSRPRLDFRRW